MAKTYIKELQETIEQLQDGFDMRSVENALLQNEIEDTQLPNKLLGEQSGYLLDMLNEVLVYEKKMPSQRITDAKNRLINLLHINTQLNKILSYDHSLRLFNRELVGKIQLLRVENHKLKDELQKVTLSKEF